MDEEKNVNEQPEDLKSDAPEVPGEMAQEPPIQPDPTPEPPAQETSYGPIVGIIIIVILMILAAFYFWGENLEKMGPTDAPAAEDGGAAGTVPAGSEGAGDFNDTPGTDVGGPVSDSDAIEDIEQELDNTDLDNLDAELEDIEAELNQQ